ncbi:MAG: hypothetical protein BGN96_01660 [Bacteroidales bacterium 45-6]|nr:MAG: hypothetical protein BGN96_01660 [Bacteroidales bacterium 45-6]
MNILSLDQAAKTGYAIYHNGRIIASGTWKLPAKHKHLWYTRKLQETVKKYDITAIVAESGFFDCNRPRAATSLWELNGILQLVNGQNNMKPITYVEPDQLKKSTTGNRWAKKAEMIEAVKFLGYNPDTDDEADAIAIMQWYTKLMGIPIRHPNK